MLQYLLFWFRVLYVKLIFITFLLFWNMKVYECLCKSLPFYPVLHLILRAVECHVSYKHCSFLILYLFKTTHTHIWMKSQWSRSIKCGTIAYLCYSEDVCAGRIAVCHNCYCWFEVKLWQDSEQEWVSGSAQ